MRDKWWITVLMLLAVLSASAAGQQDQLQEDSLKADSINRVAAHPDFVKVWLMTVTPSNESISAFGHAALRLQCPSEQLDYCFTFSMASDNITLLKYVRGAAKGGFESVPAEMFLQRYREEGRGVSQVQLNLLPHEEQELWRLLDHEVEQGARWDYNVITTNCTSMCIWAVEQCLDKEHIEYHQLDPIMNAPYSEFVHSICAYEPWLELMLYIRFFKERNEVGDINNKFSPSMLMSSWQKATLVDEAGNSRQMTTGRVLTLYKALPQSMPRETTITPMKVLAGLLLIAALFIIFIIIRKRIKQK